MGNEAAIRLHVQAPGGQKEGSVAIFVRAGAVAHGSVARATAICLETVEDRRYDHQQALPEGPVVPTRRNLPG